MPTFTERLKAIHFNFNDLPADFKDAVHLSLMENPVTLSDGHIYDESTAIMLLSSPVDSRKSPFTQEPLKKEMFPSHIMRKQIIEFIEKQEQKNKNCQAFHQKILDKYKATKLKVQELQGQLKSAQNSMTKEKKHHNKEVQGLLKNNEALNKKLKKVQDELEQAKQATKPMIHKEIEQWQETEPAVNHSSGLLGFFRSLVYNPDPVAKPSAYRPVAWAVKPTS